MYCEDSLGTDIEHFWPKMAYPERAFAWDNYLLACSHCNSNLKRTQFPLDDSGAPRLIDPTRDEPAKHLMFLPSNGEFDACGPKGEDTILVFGLNDDAPPRRLPTGRRDALVCLTALLIEYDRRVEKGRGHADIKDVMLRHPFGSVLQWLVQTAGMPGAEAVLGPDIFALVQTHELHGWSRDVEPLLT
jgi:hypothetical protein